MYKKKKRKKRLEFSKVIVVVANVLVWIVSVANMVYMFMYTDSSAMAYLIPSIFTLASSMAVSYYFKARKENEIKLPYYLEDNNELGGF